MSAFDHLSREELIALLEKKQAERKLGLVWERNEIEHEKALSDGFVAMEIDKELSVGDEPHRNLIIEGDNFGYYGAAEPRFRFEVSHYSG